MMLLSFDPRLIRVWHLADTYRQLAIAAPAGSAEKARLRDAVDRQLGRALRLVEAHPEWMGR